jgi:predicted transcriptional regulator
MRTFSITLSNQLADSSQKVADSVGLTRAQFIRIAIQHETQRIERQQTLEAMAESFKAMQKNKKYLEESEAIEQGLNTELPKEEDEWWKKH